MRDIYKKLSYFFVGSKALSFCLGFFLAIFLSYIFYRMSLPLVPFIYVAF